MLVVSWKSRKMFRAMYEGLTLIHSGILLTRITTHMQSKGRPQPHYLKECITPDCTEVLKLLSVQFDLQNESLL